MSSMFAITPNSSVKSEATGVESVPVTPLNPYLPADLPTRCIDDPRQIPPRKLHFLLTLVLDVDETLLDARTNPHAVYLRPYVRQFLQSVHQLRAPLGVHQDGEGPRAVEIVIWSAGLRQHVDRCLDILDPDGTLVDVAICRGESWLPSSHSVALKDLSLLAGRKASSFLIDDSFYAAVRSGTRALVVPAFKQLASGESDTTLLFVLEVVTYVANTLATDRLDRALDHPHIAVHLARSGGSPLKSSPRHSFRQVETGSRSSSDSSESDTPLPPSEAVHKAARILRMARVLPHKENNIPSGAGAGYVAAVTGSFGGDDRWFTSTSAAVAEDFQDGAAVTTAMIAARVLRRPSDPEVVTPPSSEDGDSVEDEEELPPEESSLPKVSAFAHWYEHVATNLEDAPVIRVMQSHPFLSIEETFTPLFGSIPVLKLDVVDTATFGQRISQFLSEYSKPVQLAFPSPPIIEEHFQDIDEVEIATHKPGFKSSTKVRRKIKRQILKRTGKTSRKWMGINSHSRKNTFKVFR